VPYGALTLGRRIAHHRALRAAAALAFGVGPSGPTSTAELHYQRLGTGGRVTTTVDSFALLPFLLPGTRLIALVQEKLARALQRATDIRLLEPPVPSHHSG
jgi:LysR family transcriptional regulator, nod-box dependent transcriptional activator